MRRKRLVGERKWPEMRFTWTGEIRTPFLMRYATLNSGQVESHSNLSRPSDS